jgi:hypothetical protein
MVILGVKTHQSEWHSEERRGAGLWHFATSPHGYTDNALGLEGLEKGFHPQTVAAVAGRWRYLICDGNAIHESPDILSFLCTKSIFSVSLPIHYTSLNPLTMGVSYPSRIFIAKGSEK